MSLASPAAAPPGKVVLHVILGAVGLVAVAILINVIGRRFIDIDGLREWVGSFGPAAPMVFIGVSALGHLVFLPVAPFTVAAIALFHWPTAVVAILVSHNLAANLGYAVPFVFGKERIKRMWLKHPKMQEFDCKICERGFVTVFLLRVIPALPFSLVSYLSAVSCIKWGRYAMASFLGMLPGPVLLGFAMATGRLAGWFPG